MSNATSTIDPASATLALFSALPTTLRNLALTNPAAAVSAIQSEFATGTPTWFTAVPTDVQSYFITQANVLGNSTPTSSAGLVTSEAGPSSVLSTAASLPLPASTSNPLLSSSTRGVLSSAGGLSAPGSTSGTLSSADDLPPPGSTSGVLSSADDLPPLGSTSDRRSSAPASDTSLTPAGPFQTTFSTGTSSSGSLSTSSSTPETSAAAPPSGISTGAKIGIGVAVPLIALAGLVLLIVFFVKRRKARMLRGPVGIEKYNAPQHDPSDEKQVVVPLIATQRLEQQQKEVVQGHAAFSPTPIVDVKQQPLHGPDRSSLPEVVHEMGDTREPPTGSYSDLPEVAQVDVLNEDAELRELEVETQRLNERRSRLVEMERLDADEREVRRRYESRLAQLGKKLARSSVFDGNISGNS